MKKRLFDIFIWMTTAVFIGFVFVLPNNVPIHWNFNWEVDGYGSRYMILILALLPIACYYGMLITMKIDPKRKSFKEREKTYLLMRKFISFIFILLAIFFFYMTFNPKANGMLVMMCLLGIMFIVMGNYMPRLPQNYFLGVKTPWTLANEKVWKKTNTVGGYGFVIFGILCIICGLISFEYSFYVILIGSLVEVIGVCAYSYYIYKKIDKIEEN